MTPMNDMPQMLAFTLLVAILFIGDAISVRTKAWVPSVFVSAILFLFGYWTFFPKDIVAKAGVPAVVAVLTMYLLIVNMGTLLSVRELTRQWKTIVISLSSILGIIAVCFGVGYFFFELNTIIVAIPPLVGGIVSALIMSTEATRLGLDELAVFAVVIYVMQGFAGYPLTSIVLKREGREVLARYREGQHANLLVEEAANAQPDIVVQEKMPRLFKRIPTSYNTSYFRLLRIAIVALCAYLFSEVAKPIVTISPFVLCLLFGVIATSAGFLEKHPLQKANGFGFCVMALMVFIFDGLNRATPEMLLGLLMPLVVLVSLAVIGMYIFSAIAGRLLGVSRNMAFAVSLTALYGFPADYIITNEVINTLTKDPKERQALAAHMLGPMLIGGFISVTMVSVILAGIMATWLTA